MPAERCSPIAARVRVTERHERGVTTSVEIAPDEAVFAGHYPGFPIFPGVCLLECAIQSAHAAAAERGRAVEIEAVESTRFLSPVFPGDTVVTRVEVTESADRWRCAAALSTGRGRAAEARLRVRPLADDR